MGKRKGRGHVQGQQQLQRPDVQINTWRSRLTCGRNKFSVRPSTPTLLPILAAVWVLGSVFVGLVGGNREKVPEAGGSGRTSRHRVQKKPHCSSLHHDYQLRSVSSEETLVRDFKEEDHSHRVAPTAQDYTHPHNSYLYS